MTTILGLSGSLRRASINTAMLQAAVELAPENARISIGSIAEVPLYNSDEESEHGTPEAVARLNRQLAASDGLLLVTPEYNNGVPAACSRIPLTGCHAERAAKVSAVSL